MVQGILGFPIASKLNSQTPTSIKLLVIFSSSYFGAHLFFLVKQIDSSLLPLGSEIKTTDPYGIERVPITSNLSNNIFAMCFHITETTKDHAALAAAAAASATTGAKSTAADVPSFNDIIKQNISGFILVYLFACLMFHLTNLLFLELR